MAKEPRRAEGVRLNGRPLRTLHETRNEWRDRRLSICLLVLECAVASSLYCERNAELLLRLADEDANKVRARRVPRRFPKACLRVAASSRT